MSRDQLYAVVDYILNHALEKDLDVIEEAVNRRKKAGGFGSLSFNPAEMAKKTNAQIQAQVGMGEEQIRQMVRGFCDDMLTRQAPELNPAQRAELLDHWMKGTGPKTGSLKDQTGLPADVLKTMVQQFLSYTEGTMPPSQQMELERQISDWQKAYWSRFPEKLRKLIKFYLEDRVTPEEFWATFQEIY